ncbi:hypothetical protein [Dictyobacter arantiisoli]|uniref:Uncharacterized protein n=1 Tax=Dictyobacter arantiisoli TaxID=2014874 RepID=A0A5A5TKM7_9CHLR|nr:hypothetical protein [Dictyobacter arantiisoli]GCF12027.1 hypothetical protein KDI_55910 [Dictyobacter arantiisoli]
MPFPEHTAGHLTETVNPSELFAPSYEGQNEGPSSQNYQSHEDQASDLSWQGPSSDNFRSRDAFPYTPADVQRALYLSHEDQASDLSWQGPSSDNFRSRDAFPYTPADVQRALYLSHENQTSDLSGQGPSSDNFRPLGAVPHTPSDVQKAIYLSHENQISGPSGQGPYSGLPVPASFYPQQEESNARYLRYGDVPFSEDTDPIMSVEDYHNSLATEGPGSQYYQSHEDGDQISGPSGQGPFYSRTFDQSYNDDDFLYNEPLSPSPEMQPQDAASSSDNFELPDPPSFDLDVQRALYQPHGAPSDAPRSADTSLVVDITPTSSYYHKAKPLDPHLRLESPGRDGKPSTIYTAKTNQWSGAARNLHAIRAAAGKAPLKPGWNEVPQKRREIEGASSLHDAYRTGTSVTHLQNVSEGALAKRQERRKEIKERKERKERE